MTELTKQPTIETTPSQTHKLFLTIAIPTINRLSYLQETLASVLSQTSDNFEILVSNNCSHDGTKEFLDRLTDPRLRIYHQDTLLDMVANWNFLLDHANGEYFLLLSDDDLIGTDFVERCAEALSGLHSRDERINIIYGSYGIIDANGTVLTYRKNDSLEMLETGEEFNLNWFKNLRPVAFCSTLFRTESLKSIIGFDGTNKYAADAVARAKVSANNHVMYVREAIAYYRVHDANATHQSFTPVDRLRYNLDISLQAITDIANREKKDEIKKAGEKYAKTVFIAESAAGSLTGFKFRMITDFITAYLRHFSVADLLFFGLAHYLRRIILENKLRRLVRVGD